MNDQEKAQIKETITRMANNIRMSPANMEDLITEGQITLRYTFDIRTGQLIMERLS